VRRKRYLAAHGAEQIKPSAVPPGSSPNERRLPFPPAAARLHRASPDLRPVAGVVGRLPCTSGTAPATSTAARTSRATTVALSATPRWRCCTA
jgi:hypothetical protein